MGVGWIDNVYNNTDKQWYLKSLDDSHNGAISRDGRQLFTLDDHAYHGLSAHTQFHADWCGIPWYYQGRHYKAMSSDQQRNVQFYTSDVEGKNWIYYLDGLTGNIIGRQQAPRVDFRCNLRFETTGNFIDIVNDSGNVQETVAFLYNEFKQWVQIGLGAFGATIKGKSDKPA